MAENKQITPLSFEEEDNPDSPEDPESKKEIEQLTPENKHIILETDNSVLIDCTVQWMNMLNEDLQRSIVERVTFVKQEVNDEQDVEEVEEEVQQEPEVPPTTTTKVSIETQTGFPGDAPQPGSSQQREVPTSTASSHQREEAKEEKGINVDDTAPTQESATMKWYDQDISGNELDSVLRRLSECFTDGYHSIWAGSYNLGFPAFPNNRHMLWHKKYRQTNKPHAMTWFVIEETHMMEAYIQRHKDEQVTETLEDLKRDAEYSCANPRMHLRVREDVNCLTRIATERHQENFEPLHGLIEDYIQDHHCIPYAVVLQLLAIRYLGAGLLETEHLDWECFIEVQKVSPVCFGIWVAGNGRLTANAHCLNTWRNSDHVPGLISTLNINRLGKDLCTTTILSQPSRTLLLTYF